MGCGYSTPQLQQPLDQAAAAASGEDHQGRSPNHNNKLLSCMTRRRVDSLRRRRKRVGDAVTMEETITLSSKHLINAAAASPNHHDDKTMICKADEEKIDDDNRGSVVVIEAVWRAIEDVLLSEEREYAAQQRLNNDHKSVSSKDMVVKRQTFVPQSPSFRVYCTRVDSFDSNYSSSTKFNDDNAVKDVAKTKYRRRKSVETVSSEDDEGSTTSSKNKMEGERKREITKKAGGSNWKLGPPLGMKNLFVTSSCYSCSPNNRDRLLSRG